MSSNILRQDTDVRGFFAVQNDIIDNDTLLNATEKLMYIVLLRYGERVFPSFTTIAKHCGISRRTAIRTMESLVEKGVVKKQARKRNDGGKDSNLYTLVNTRELWASHSEEEANVAVSAAEEAALVARLQKMGYNVTKKEPALAGTSTDSNTPKSINKYQGNRTTYSRKKQSHINGSGVTVAEVERSRQAMLQMLGDD